MQFHGPLNKFEQSIIDMTTNSYMNTTDMIDKIMREIDTLLASEEYKHLMTPIEMKWLGSISTILVRETSQINTIWDSLGKKIRHAGVYDTDYQFEHFSEVFELLSIQSKWEGYFNFANLRLNSLMTQLEMLRHYSKLEPITEIDPRRIDSAWTLFTHMQGLTFRNRNIKHKIRRIQASQPHNSQNATLLDIRQLENCYSNIIQVDSFLETGKYPNYDMHYLEYKKFFKKQWNFVLSYKLVTHLVERSNIIDREVTYIAERIGFKIRLDDEFDIQ